MLDCPLPWGPTILDGFVSGTLIGLGSMLSGALMLLCLTFWSCLPQDLFVHIEDFRADTLCHFDPLCLTCIWEHGACALQRVLSLLV